MGSTIKRGVGMGVLILVVMLMFLGCAGTVQLYKMEHSICNDANRPMRYVGHSSWICKVSNDNGFVPEVLGDLLLDAAAITYVSERVSKEDMTAFFDQIEVILDAACDESPWTYARLFEMMEVEGEKYALIVSILSRRVNVYSTRDMRVGVFDCWMFREHVKMHRAQLGI